MKLEMETETQMGGGDKVCRRRHSRANCKWGTEELPGTRTPT